MYIGSTPFERTILKRLDAIRTLNPLPPGERRSKGVRDLSVGGFFHLPGGTYKILTLGHYQEWNWKFKKEKSFQAFEMKVLCLETGEERTIEYGLEEDGELEISLTGEKTRLMRVTDGNGRPLSEARIDDLDDGDPVIFDRKQYYYDDDESWAALYRSSMDDDTPEKVRMYEFIADDDSQLTVEVWMEDGDKDCEVFTSTPIHENDIEILQAN